MSRFRAVSQVDPGWIVAAVLPLIGILPAIGSGVIDAADGPYHVHRIYTMSVMLREGDWWPRWIPYYHLGFGYPIFIFYPPGVSYLGGLLVLLSGIGSAAAFNLVSALAWITGSTGTYGLARRLLPPAGAILAAMLWAYAPSRLLEVWYQGGLAQMMSAALVPWLFYGLVLTAQQPTRRHLLVIAFSLAGIVLTHIPMAYVAGLHAGIAALIFPAWEARHDRRTFSRRFGTTVAGLALGAGLAAIFVLPMILELKYIRAAQEHVETVSYLKTRFVLLRDIFAQPRPIDLTDMNLHPPITLGLVGSLLGLAGLAALVMRRRYGMAILLTAALAMIVFLMQKESLDVWLAIPYFRQIRFPERLLRFGSIWLALLGGSSLLLLPDRWRIRSLVITLPVVLIAALPMVYGTGAFVEFGELSALDEIVFEQQDKVWGTTSYDEYDPVWGERIPYPKTVPEPDAYIDDPLRIAVYPRDLESPGLEAEALGTARLRLVAAGARPVRFHQYYYPGWKATLDGQPVRVYPEDEMGLLTIDIPAGEHIVELEYGGTTAQKAGTAITLVSLGMVLALIIPRKGAASSAPTNVPVRADQGAASSAPTNVPVRAGQGAASSAPTDASEGAREERFPRVAAVCIVGAVTGFALLTGLYIAPHTRWLRHESPPDDPVYMEHAVHQPFSDVFELLGYTLEADSVTPGQTFRIMLFWRPLREITDDHRTRVQLVNLPVTEAWAVSEPPFPHGAVGFTPDRFASDRHDLSVYDWVPPYMGRISVQIIRESDGAVIPLPDGSERLILPVLIRVRGSGPAAANKLDYQLGRAAELRCASVETHNDQLDITLYWHVTQSPGQDLSVFVHGLDADGHLVAQNDAPALGLDYPARYWQKGQNLVDHHTLPADPAIRQIAVGLYTPETRLPVTQHGQPVPDDRILLPVAPMSCR